MQKTTLYLPDDLQRQLRDVSKRSGRSQADLVRAAVERFLAAADMPEPSSIGSGEDDELAARDASDWLHARWLDR
jgi:hypothetical protein